MEKEKAAQKIIDAAHELTDRGLVARTWGNISARLSDSEFLITPSGRSYDTMKPEDLVTVSISNLAFTGDVRPSSEKGVHASVYSLHPEAEFVIHTHQSYATAFAVLGEDLPDIPEDRASILGPTVPCAVYGMNGTKTLQMNVNAAQQRCMDSHAVLMKSHGALFFGATTDDAFRAAFALEGYCEKLYAKETGNDAWHIYTPAEAEDQGLLSYHHGSRGTNVFVKTPVLKAAAIQNNDIEIYTDDAAQFFGTKIRCLPRDADQKQIFYALKTCPVVLIEGKGMVALGPTRDEAEAAFMVAEKNCLASFLSKAAKKGDPLSVLLQVYEHTRYMKSYSRLKV